MSENFQVGGIKGGYSENEDGTFSYAFVVTVISKDVFPSIEEAEVSMKKELPKLIAKIDDSSPMDFMTVAVDAEKSTEDTIEGTITDKSTN